MSAFVFNQQFYFTAAALLARMKHIYNPKNYIFIESIENDISILLESNYEHYMKFNNLSIFEIKNNIDENIKEVKKILNENRFDYYLNKFYVNKFINELRFFSYNSDGRNEIYKILYTLYNESVHFEKDSFKDIS